MSVALLTLGPASCTHTEAAMLSDVSNTKYHVGDQWTYRTRPGEGDSTLTIGKVETTPKLGMIVHIGLAGLRIKNAHAPTGYSDTIAHMPFAVEALDKSVTGKVATAAVPLAFADGYGEWRRAFWSPSCGHVARGRCDSCPVRGYDSVGHDDEGAVGCCPRSVHGRDDRRLQLLQLPLERTEHHPRSVRLERRRLVLRDGLRQHPGVSRR